MPGCLYGVPDSAGKEDVILRAVANAVDTPLPQGVQQEDDITSAHALFGTEQV